MGSGRYGLETLRDKFEGKDRYRVRLIYDVWKEPGKPERTQVRTPYMDIEEAVSRYGNFIYTSGYTEGWCDDGRTKLSIWAIADESHATDPGLKKFSFKDVTADNYGGGCHMFYGHLDDETWFYTTDSWDYSYITGRDLSDRIYADDFETACDTEAIRVFEGEDHWEFRKQMLEYITAHGHPEFENYDA